MTDGGPAFPRSNTEDRNGYGDSGWEGMSLRDYFAAMALQGQIAANVQQDVYSMAVDAYAYADAMLATRDREES